MGLGLVGRVLGSVGMGNIGAELFRLAKPFDMRFIAHDPYADAKVATELGVELVSLEDIFRQADIVSVNCPLTPQTRGLVNAERLALMKPTAYLINTARGPIIDQKALTATLRANRIAGAGLDVLEHEPSDLDDPILTLHNVILGRTHCAGPISASAATVPPTSRRCWTSSTDARRISWSTAPCSIRSAGAAAWPIFARASEASEGRR